MSDLNTITTREMASKLAEGDGPIDLTGFQFISRAAADQIVREADGREIKTPDNDVGKMIEVVRPEGA